MDTRNNQDLCATLSCAHRGILRVSGVKISAHTSLIYAKNAEKGGLISASGDHSPTTHRRKSTTDRRKQRRYLPSRRKTQFSAPRTGTVPTTSQPLARF